MKRIAALTMLMLLIAAPVSADLTKIYAQSLTPKETLSVAIVKEFNKIVQTKGEFEVGYDKYEPSIQVQVRTKKAYDDIYSLSVTFLVFNGSCFCFFNSYVVSTKQKLAQSEAQKIYSDINRYIKDLYLLF